MKAEEFIEQESLLVGNTNCLIISKEKALKAVEIARNEKPEHIDTVQDCELAVRVTKERAVEAFTQCNLS